MLMRRRWKKKHSVRKMIISLLAVKRVKQVLNSMVRHKIISQDEADRVEL